MLPLSHKDPPGRPRGVHSGKAGPERRSTGPGPSGTAGAGGVPGGAGGGGSSTSADAGDERASRATAPTTTNQRVVRIYCTTNVSESGRLAELPPTRTLIVP